MTETGKELKALISKQTQQESDAEEDEEDEDKMEESVSSVDEAKKSQDNSKDTLGLKREADSSTSSSPPTKRQKTESTSTISAEEVKKYLLRKPMTSKALVKKFVKLKTDMDKQRVVTLLGSILKSMSQINKQEIKGKMYLSLSHDTEEP